MPLILDGTKGETFPSWTTATRPATPNAGQTGYNTTLATLERYNGTTWGPVVTTGDTGTVTGTMLASATVTPTNLSQPLTSGTAQASTSGTSIDFTGIPSWVKRITVMFNGVSTNGSSDILIQIGAGSVTTTGYVALRTYIQTTSAVSNLTTTSGIGIFANAGATSNYYGSFTISLMGSNMWVLSGLIGSITNTIMSYSNGGITLSGALDRVRVTTVNGTDAFDAGTINILYE